MLKNIKVKFERLFILINHKSFQNVIKIVLNYIFEQFIAIGHIYKVELSGINYVQKDNDLEFKRMNELDLELMQKKYYKEFNETIQSDILSNLHIPNVEGFIVKNRDDICGYFFLAYGKSESEKEKKYLNIEKNGYIFSDYVFEKYRGKKIHQYSIYKRLIILKEKKYMTATCLIQNDNVPSIKSYEKFGFHKYLIKYFFKFGNLLRSKDHYKNI